MNPMNVNEPTTENEQELTADDLSGVAGGIIIIGGVVAAQKWSFASFAAANQDLTSGA